MLTAPPFLVSLLAAPVAVLGDGVSGRAAAKLVSKLGSKVVIYDERGGDHVETEFVAGAHQLLITSPGFELGHSWVIAGRSAGLVCLTEIDFAALFWRGEVVAVTGTNGKTTVTEFLSFALSSAGKDACAVGNVGNAFSEVVAKRDGGAPDSIAICEVSSFQAEALHHFRADAAIWTNFAEDHLERHASLQGYFMAKWRLFERAIGGQVFAGSSVARAAEEFGQSLPEGAIVDTEESAGDILLRGTAFDTHPQRENFLLAAAWWRAAGLREPVLYAAARNYETNFHATEAALSQFGGKVVLIAGGKSKGGNIEAFVDRIQSRLKHVLLIGETRNILATLFGAAGVPHTVCEDLAGAVRGAINVSASGDDILLSPGFSSLDQFADYAERGEAFVQLLKSAPHSS